jgi:hypothetical protein
MNHTIPRTQVLLTSKRIFPTLYRAAIGAFYRSEEADHKDFSKFFINRLREFGLNFKVLDTRTIAIENQIILVFDRTNNLSNAKEKLRHTMIREKSLYGYVLSCRPNINWAAIQISEKNYLQEAINESYRN